MYQRESTEWEESVREHFCWEAISPQRRMPWPILVIPPSYLLKSKATKMSRTESTLSVRSPGLVPSQKLWCSESLEHRTYQGSVGEKHRQGRGKWRLCRSQPGFNIGCAFMQTDRRGYYRTPQTRLTFVLPLVLGLSLLFSFVTSLMRHALASAILSSAKYFPFRAILNHKSGSYRQSKRLLESWRAHKYIYREEEA